MELITLQRRVELLEGECSIKEDENRQLRNELKTKEDSRKQLVVSNQPMCGVTRLYSGCIFAEACGGAAGRCPGQE